MRITLSFDRLEDRQLTDAAAIGPIIHNPNPPLYLGPPGPILNPNAPIPPGSPAPYDPTMFPMPFPTPLSTPTSPT